MTKTPQTIKLQEHLETARSFIASFLDSSSVVYIAVLDKKGRIQLINPSLAKLLKTDGKRSSGKNFSHFLTTPDGETLTQHLSSGVFSPEDKLLLNVVDMDHFPHSLYFRTTSINNGFLLMGEPRLDDKQALEEELMQLNNQLAVLSRENIRKSRELAKALEELKQTQAMLVHKEKMASLGQMTAGIAHEINNPLSFVLNNEQVLERDFHDLLAFINTLGDALPEIAPLLPEIHESIIGKANEVGLEYLAQAMPRKMEANIQGLERVKQIVLDLRIFSRLDEADRKLCDLAEGIESTLRFLGPLIREHDVVVETDFAQLPQILISPGPLNQAINNVLTNAVQASRAGQTVRVSTRLLDEWCCLEVEDKGTGIPAEHLAKVFDPFFTTKPVGSGTGLGLSIAHQIVEAHSGRMEIDSIPDRGTRVRILLPF